MKRAWFALLLLCLAAGSAFSDSSNLEGGVFIAHHPPGLQYSEGENWCARYFQNFAIDSCSEQNNRIDTQGDHSVWFVLAAWSEEKEWRGVEFGLAAYDSTICALTSWGPCFPDGGGLEIPTGGWPGPNDGTTLTATGDPWSGNFLPVYYFVSYAYYAGEIPLGVHPITGFGGTANCETPPQAWSAASFGSMGIFEDGVYACTEAASGDGGDSPAGGGEQTEGQGDSEEDPAPASVWTVCPFGSAQFSSIQEAINSRDVLEGDILELCDATFTGDLNRNIVFNGKAIVLRSASDNPANCIIDCADLEDASAHGFLIDADDDSPGPRIVGITIRNAVGGGGT
jgi:hypothetical protein